ncbi:hypothetical protein ACLOJK_007669 [Asimina triloba]
MCCKERSSDNTYFDLRSCKRAYKYGVVETFVKSGKEDDALHLFKNLDKFNCSKDRVSLSIIVQALCSKGHAKMAESVVLRHRNKIPSEPCIYNSLLHGLCTYGNVKEEGDDSIPICMANGFDEHSQGLGNEENIVVATGNWGCGIFGGDPELKSIIQWLVLSEVSQWIMSQGWTVGDLRKMLVKYVSEVEGEIKQTQGDK